MGLGVHTSEGELALLAAARDGDEQAFERLLDPYRRPLHAHCYRLLGSLYDADDALQETLVRAWRGLGDVEWRGSLAPWLYRIATNASLRAIDRRKRTPDTLDPATAEIATYLQPYPDAPDEAVVERESLGIAFVSLVQLLPARQRAVLVLRDVLGWSAREVAEALGDSVSSVNSALQRARERLERERSSGGLGREHAPASSEAEARVLARFLAAWEAVDVDAIVELLADDAVLTMPPEPLRFDGPEAIGGFFRTVPADGELDRIRLLPARASGQPALAAYFDEGDGVFRAYGVMVFALAGEFVASITGFAGDPELPPRLGLPREL
jgi:RNA polymerase sigma-70 factor (TIGR02960 family)